jgi:hypothetical protein
MSPRLALNAIPVLFALISPLPSSASEPEQHLATVSSYEHVIDPLGFVVAVPKLSRYAVISDLQVATERLSSRQAYLAEKTERPIGIGGAIIVVVVPGGLLYGAYKLRQWTVERNELAALEDQLHDLRSDAARLAASGYGEQVALANPP